MLVVGRTKRGEWPALPITDVIYNQPLLVETKWHK